jgi:hypothetical protein
VGRAALGGLDRIGWVFHLYRYFTTLGQAVFHKADQNTERMQTYILHYIADMRINVNNTLDLNLSISEQIVHKHRIAVVFDICLCDTANQK